MGKFGGDCGSIAGRNLQPAKRQNETGIRPLNWRHAVLLFHGFGRRPDDVAVHRADVEFENDGPGEQTSVYAHAVDKGSAGSAVGQTWFIDGWTAGGIVE